MFGDDLKPSCVARPYELKLWEAMGVWRTRAVVSTLAYVASSLGMLGMGAAYLYQRDLNRPPVAQVPVRAGETLTNKLTGDTAMVVSVSVGAGTYHVVWLDWRSGQQREQVDSPAVLWDR